MTTTAIALLSSFAWSSLPASFILVNQVSSMAETATGVLLRVSGYTTDGPDVNANELREICLLTNKEQQRLQRTSASHPVMKELEQQDFYAQLLFTRALLRDIETLLRQGDQDCGKTCFFYSTSVPAPVAASDKTTSALLTPSMPKSLETALVLVEDVIQQIADVVMELEKLQHEHVHKWFSSWRKLNVNPQFARLKDLAPKLKARTEQLLQIHQFWKK